MRRPFLAAALVISLAACGSGKSGDRFTMQQPEGYVSLAPVRADEISWSRARTVRVTFEYLEIGEPFVLTFEVGVPYRLILHKAERFFYNCVSAAFFKAIATRKLITNAGTVEYPFVQVIGVMPGDSKELQLIPMRRGTYALLCSDPDHPRVERNGTITVR